MKRLRLNLDQLSRELEILDSEYLGGIKGGYGDYSGGSGGYGGYNSWEELWHAMQHGYLPPEGTYNPGSGSGGGSGGYGEGYGGWLGWYPPGGSGGYGGYSSGGYGGYGEYSSGGYGGYVGAISQSWDCVLNCFDYLDGSSHDWDFYNFSIHYNLGYNGADYGGVRTDDIINIGSFGGMAVTDLGSVFSMSGDGKVGGNHVIITYQAVIPGTDHTVVPKADHAVIAEGHFYEDGKLMIRFYDPTTGLRDKLDSKAATGYYAVSGTSLGD